MSRERRDTRIRRIRHVLSTNGQVPLDPLREPASGVVGAALSVAITQAAHGQEVELVGWRDGQPARTQIDAVSVVTHPGWQRLRLGRWDLRWLAPMAAHTLRGDEADVLHVHVEPNLLRLPRAQHRVLHLQTPVATPMPPAYQRLLARADGVICCSAFLRQRFLQAADYPSQRVFVVHNGADMARFDAADGQALRAAWGYGPQDVVVLYAGAVLPQKGVIYAIRAVEQVRTQHGNVHLVVVGASSLWLGLGAPAAASGLQRYEAEVRRSAGDGVRYAGLLPRSEMPAAFKAADVVIVPSLWDDPHPTVVCEAMAAGRPVVASAVGGITETVLDGETGRLVPPGDAAPLAEAIEQLATSEALRAELGRRGRQHAGQYLSWEQSARELDAIYDELERQPR
ncbi:MAG: glycosyltransferase family 4 protein [Chloroflexota bacterium]